MTLTALHLPLARLYLLARKPQSRSRPVVRRRTETTYQQHCGRAGGGEALQVAAEQQQKAGIGRCRTAWQCSPNWLTNMVQHHPRCIPDDNRAASHRCGCRNALYTACCHTWAWGDPRPAWRENQLFRSSKTGTPAVFGVVRATNGCL